MITTDIDSLIMLRIALVSIGRSHLIYRLRLFDLFSVVSHNDVEALQLKSNIAP